MTRSARILVYCSLAVTTLGGIGYAYPELPYELGLDFWNEDELRHNIDQHHSTMERIQQQSRIVYNRIQIKERLTDQLLAGERTIFDVAEEFHQMNLMMPAYMTSIRATFPGKTDEEKMCWNVLGYAHMRAEQLRLPHDRLYLMQRQIEERFGSMPTH